METLSRTLSSPLGHLLVTTDTQAIIALDFVEKGDCFHSDDHPLLDLAEQQLKEYFEQQRDHFSLPLAPHGTPFQERVWATLQTIPYGTTISYAQESILMDHPKATRAVANANGHNPLSILIPCHRVIASDGSLGGYSGGLWRKKYLLSLEGAVPK